MGLWVNTRVYGYIKDMSHHVPYYYHAHIQMPILFPYWTSGL